MAGSRQADEELVRAVRRKLGLPVDGDPARCQAVWVEFVTDPRRRDQLKRLARFLREPFERAGRYQLALSGGASGPEDAEFLKSLYAAFQQWVNGNPIRNSLRVSGLIRTALTAAAPAAVPARRPTAPRPVPPPDDLPDALPVDATTSL